MDSLLRHRYVAALVLSGTVFLVGTIVVVSRSAISPTGTMSGIDINGVIQTTDPAAPIPRAPAPVRPIAVDVPYTKVNTQPAPPAPPPKSDYFDWESFVSALSFSPPPPPPGAPSLDPYLSDAYAYVPSGLISIEEQTPLSKMNESQKKLYGWGSDAGGVIMSYENGHQNQVAILTDFMQDRQNSGKIAGMKQLGADLQAVGNSLDVIPAPPQMAMAAPALAEAYREIGRNLAVIPDAQGDEALVAAILHYNKSAEAFVQKFVNVVLIFQINEVRFSQNEPGSVFMFPSN